MAIGYIVLAYLLGSIPFGWLLSRFKNGKDLRKIGSGATGATNTFRASGFVIALLTAFLDVSKAILPTLLVVHYEPSQELLHVLVGSAAMLGHTKSVFLGFRGGKAVSPAAGALIAIATNQQDLFWILLPAIVLMISAILITKGRVSAGSLSGCTAAALTTVGLTVAGEVSTIYCVWVVLSAGYITIMHWPNIKRLVNGTEPSIFDRGRKT